MALSRSPLNTTMVLAFSNCCEPVVTGEVFLANTASITRPCLAPAPARQSLTSLPKPLHPHKNPGSEAFTVASARLPTDPSFV